MKILCNFARVILNNVTFKTVNADLTALPKHNKLIIKTINFLFTFNNYFIMKYFKLKFLLLFAALAVALPPAWAASVTDVITAADLAATSTSYTDFSGVTKPSGAVYAGRTALNGTAIQINSNEPIGIVSSSSGGTVKSITLYFSTLQTSTKTINVYGKHSAYSTAKDLYDKSTRGTLIQGLSSYNYNGNKYTITDDYEYIGISSNSGAAYIDKIEIEWSTPEDYEAQLVSNGSINFGKTAPNTPITKDVTVKNTGLQPITPVVSVSGVEFSTTYTPTTIAKGETATIPLVFTPTTTGTFEGTLHIGAQESENISLDASLSGISAYELTVCNNNETSGYLPVYGYNHDSYNQINQMVYPSTMLQSLNGKKITTMTFHLSDGLKFYNGDVTFSLANLSANTPPYESSPTRIEGFTKVHTEVMPGSSQPSLTEWTILFDEPFTYTGGDLLIDVATTKGDWGTTYFYGATQGSNQSYYTSANNTYTPVKFLPKITFGYEDGGAVVEPTPELVVDPDELDLDEATTFTVMGSDLKGDVTITVDNANFTVTPATIIKADAEEGATVTVAYTGTNTDGEIATITVASQGAESATVTVMGAAPKPVTVEKPVFDPEDGTTFEKNLTVTLTCETTGATIQYSYNNEYFTNYAEPIVIDETTTIYAKAVLGEVESEVVSATYTKEAAPGIITDFKETFTDCDGTGGNDGSWSGNIASSAFSDSKADNAGWALVSGNAANECIKIGTGSKQGSATTPNIAVTPGITYTLTFNAGAWEGDQTTLNISATGGNLSQSTVTLNSGSWNNYTLTFTATDEIATITFSGFQASKARFFLDEIVLSHEASAQPTQVVATPTFNPAQGEYTEAQNVTITCATEDAVIHYTVDGTDPTAESPVYDEAIAVGETMTIKAIAMKEGMTNSEIATATYTINIPSGEGTTFVKVTAADQLVAGKKYIIVCGNKALGVEPTGNFLTAIDVTAGDEVTVSNEGVAIMTLGGTLSHYTLALGDKYLHATSSSTNLNFGTSTEWAIADYNGTLDGYRVKHADANRAVRYQSSNNRFGNYSTSDDNSVYGWIYVEKEEVTPEPEQVATPTFSVEAGEYTEAKSVEITCETEGAIIHYTVDGTEPTAESPVYGEAINVDKTMTIKAIAVKEGWTNSEIATATYTINYPDIVVTLNPASGSFYLDEQAHVTVTTQNTVGDTMITYQIGDGEEMEYDSENGIVITASQEGTINLTVTVADGYHEGVATVTGEYSFTARPVVTTPTFTPAAGEYTEVQNVTIACETEDATIHYTTDGTDPTAESPVFSSAITVADDMTIKAIAMKDGMVNSIIATAEYIIKLPVAAPTFSLANGTYNEPQTVTINAPEGATVYYSVDGGLTWNEGSTVNVDETTILMAKAVKKGIESPVVTAAYVINIPVTPNEVGPIKGYFSIKNNGNNMYANIQGRKTLNFTNDIDKQAGTVIWVETDNTGKVLSLRSQGADLQGYADRAMRYVPEIVELVVEKLHAEGSGEILGQTGLDAIMEKFEENFDHHLYVEKDENGYRIYGKTPSMQPVVDFYAENKSKVDAKLPMLQDFINDAIHKVIAKAGGHGTSILKDYDVHQTWERMGSNLTEPVDSASTMAFYQQVLCNEENVWSFAYESVMTYWERVKNHPRYEEIREELGEFAQYIDIIENVRPDFKYYIVQENNKPDYISQGNVNIINKEPSTYWTLEARNEFTVNIPEKRFGCPYQGGIGGYATTLYTDFAYTLPEGVKAYKVTNINENGRAIIEAINGIIPAQTPVLLAATEPGDKVFNLSTEAGTAVTDNLLVGPDYLIDKFNLTTPQVKKLFDYVKGILGEDFYNSYIAEYEHLMLKNSGTVHNKYFWALPFDDVKKCIYLMEDGTEDCVVRNLDGDSFVNNGQVEANKAFLVTEKYQTIKIFTRGDANHDGKITIGDLSAIIDRLLKVEGAGCEYCTDVNEDDRVSIIDVSTLIDVLLGY